MSKKAKAVTATIKLLINAGQAKPAPPVGPALGQAGLNIMNFCKDFNAKTADIKVIAEERRARRPFLFCGTDMTEDSVSAVVTQGDAPVPVVITA